MVCLLKMVIFYSYVKLPEGIANVIPGSTDLNNHWHLDLYGMVPFCFCTGLVLAPGVDLSISFSLLKSRDLMLEGIKLYLQ